MEYILIAILFFLLIRQGGKIADLEQRLNQNKIPGLRTNFEAQNDVPMESAPEVSSEVAPTPAPIDTPAFAPERIEPQGPSVFDQFFAWLKEDFLVKLGGLLLLIAFGWFVSFAIANDWISESGRIILGVLFGASVMILGDWRIKSFRQQGGVFLALGSGIIILSVFAGREIYDLMTPLIALVLMFISAAVVAFEAIRHKSYPLAVAGLILASVAPIFTASPDPSAVGLLTYLLVVTIGTLWIVYTTGWRMLAPIALVITILYSIPFWADGLVGTERQLAVLLSFAFTGIYLVANLVSMLVRQAEIGKAHLWTALGTGLFLILWVLTSASENLQSLILLVWTFIFSVSAYFVFQGIDNRKPFFIYAATSVVLLGAATAAHLSGDLLVMAYIIEAAILIIGTHLLLKEDLTTARTSLVYVVPIIGSTEALFSYKSGTEYFFQSSDFVVLLLMILSSFIISLFANNYVESDESRSPMKLVSNWFMFFGIVYLGMLTLLEVSDPAGLLIVFTIEVSILIALAKYVYGRISLMKAMYGLFVIPVIASIDPLLSSNWSDSVAHMDAFSVLVLTAAMFLFGAIALLDKPAMPNDEDREKFGGGLVTVAAIYVLVLIWLSLHALMPDAVATGLSLVIYTVLGLAAFIKGRVEENDFFKYAGGILIGFVVLRLLFIDVWNMTLAGRTATFFVIGVLLIATAFIGRQKGGERDIVS